MEKKITKCVMITQEQNEWMNMKGYSFTKFISVKINEEMKK